MMKGWNRQGVFGQEPGSVAEDSSSSQSRDLHRPVGVNDASDVSDSSPGSPGESPLKQKIRFLLPKSWPGVLSRWRKGDHDDYDDGDDDQRQGVTILPNGTRVSPPVSPLLERRWDPQDSLRSSEGSRKPLMAAGPSDRAHDRAYEALEGSELTSLHPAEYYAEKLEVYKLKYSYLKSWPGLLRLLAGLQLLFGGMVFACVCAYIQKDSEWSNLYTPAYLTGGYYYKGPMTFLVCLKMWRHEALRREMDSFERNLSFPSGKSATYTTIGLSSRAVHLRSRCPYHCRKYPEITSMEDREQYKAVFNDQYLEYKEVHQDVSATLRKFRQLDAVAAKLLGEVTSPAVRIRQKKNDPSFLEKMERCAYLKAKLSHIKRRIKEFDEEHPENDGT
uniref:OCEL domain-containing protein n=1 Tax=Denticeps clupeoides TaxID=299321 RepID=A0AAY4AKU7_9TELE